MPEDKKQNPVDSIDEVGSVNINNEVVSIIAGLATTEVQGVVGMSGGIVGGIAEMLGQKNLSKGVKINLVENQVVIDLYVIIEYGVNIPDTAMKIQEKVKEQVEQMSGVDVAEINIHVQGVKSSEKIKEKQSEQILK